MNATRRWINLESGGEKETIRTSTDPARRNRSEFLVTELGGGEASEFYKRQRILNWTFPKVVALTRHAQYAVQTAGSPTGLENRVLNEHAQLQSSPYSDH